VKVRNLIKKESIGRGPVAAALILALAFVGVAPLTAVADTTTAAPVPMILAATVFATPVATDTLVATLSTATPGATAALVPTPAAVAAPAKKLTVPQIITKVGHDAKLSNAEIDGLLWIAKRESNYHPTSKSKSGCYGLFQLSKGMANGHPWKDATWNTKRAIKYMKGRYHGVLNAKRFWLSHHWY